MKSVMEMLHTFIADYKPNYLTIFLRVSVVLETSLAPLPCLFVRNFIQNELCRLRVKRKQAKK